MAPFSAVFIGLLGTIALGFWLPSLARWYRLRRRTPDDIHEIREGPVELTGTARALDFYGTVTSELTGTEALLYEYEIEEYQSQGKHSNWQPVAEGSAAVPFEVTDATGQVLVDPSDADLVLRREFSETLTPDDEPSQVVRDFLATSEVDHESSAIDIGITEITYGDRHRFRERRIEPGESVYVAGIADRDVSDYRTDFGGPRTVIRAAEERGAFASELGYPFVVSDHDAPVAQRKLLNPFV